MFMSCMSVNHSVKGGFHVTISHDALDLTIQGPLFPGQPPTFLDRDLRHGHVGWQAGRWHPSEMLSCLKCSQCGHIKLF